MSLNIREAIAKGQAQLKLEHDTADKAKAGTLRAGSSGAMLGGKPIGHCPRKSLLRYMGESLPNEVADEGVGSAKNIQLMFDGGLLNEDLWMPVLDRGLPEGYVVKREEEYPVTHELPNGTKVTGRPDMVVGRMVKETLGGGPDYFEPELGIEHKCVSALNTAKSVACLGEPKLDHLIQAGFYAWKLGIPYQIWYTARVLYAVPENQVKWFPKEGEPGSQFLEFKDRFDPKTRKAKRVLSNTVPFHVIVDISWNERGQLTYTNHVTGELVHTPITKAGIEEYYLSVANALEKDVLPAKVQTVDGQGRPAKWSLCDYCPVQPVCSKYRGTSAKDWVQKVRDFRDATVPAAKTDAKSGEFTPWAQVHLEQT